MVDTIRWRRFTIPLVSRFEVIFVTLIDCLWLLAFPGNFPRLLYQFAIMFQSILLPSNLRSKIDCFFAGHWGCVATSYKAAMDMCFKFRLRKIS